ncbi:MAG TPA: anti-sigma factor [Dongiaceae bacterium]|nr:anti-sigma factor [Dongiaceae bacterium]
MSGKDPIRDPFLELMEAYALGALDGEERAAAEAHLANGCEECARALAEARAVVSELAYLAPEAQPSDILRGRLLATVRAEAAAAKGGNVAVGKTTMPWWMWAAAAAVLIFGIYNGYEARSLSEQIRAMQGEIGEQQRLRQETEQQLALAKREAVILTDPRSIHFPMPAGKSGVPAMQATWHAGLGIVVSGQGVAAPSGNRTLQLWLIPKEGGKPVPSLAVRPDAEGKFDLLVPEPPGTQAVTKALAITEEPEGGSPQPTTTAMWVGELGAK